MNYTTNTMSPYTEQSFGHPLAGIRFVIERNFLRMKSDHESEIAQCDAILSGIVEGSDSKKKLASQVREQHLRMLRDLESGYLFDKLHEIEKIFAVFGMKTVLLPIRYCTKKPFHDDWPNLKFEDTCEVSYCEDLISGNIGIVQGEASENLVSVDVDSDQDFIDFLKLNPRLSRSVKTRGSRGGNLWLRMTGEYPRVSPVKRLSIEEKWGEFRGTGGQTVVYGRHPSFEDYKILLMDQPQEIVECEFDEIIWPASVIAPRRSEARGAVEASQKAVIQQFVRRNQTFPNTGKSSPTDALKKQFDLATFAMECIPGASFHSKGVMISCPFHVERTPSCYVKVDHFHCFGCEERGDAFSLIMKQYGISFPQARNLIEKVVASGLM
ncbi:MAG: hypothetical protein JNJ70_24345 [Verrucomicrobiales bacterium]|nr:hypothetical protein [Verrucomicrobiales bacterium]